MAPSLLAGYSQYKVLCRACEKTFKTFKVGEHRCPNCQKEGRKAGNVAEWVKEVLARDS